MRPLRRRWWLPRFSLRWLLAAVTSFGIGFPIWYRWPYEERVAATSDECGCCVFPMGHRVRSWQRQWSGGRLQHGWETLFGSTGKLKSRTHFRNGRRDGPFESFDGKGRVSTRGQYHNDLEDGVWTADEEHTRHRWQLAAGKRHGEFKSTSPAFTRRLLFDWDALVGIDGQSVRRLHLWSKLPARTEGFDYDRLALQTPIPLQFVQTPLADCCLALSELWSIPVFASPDLDPQWAIDHEEGPLRLTIRESLAIVTQTNDLNWRCCYGGVCLVPEDEVESWFDSTGIGELEPARTNVTGFDWEQRATIRCEKQPLAEALPELSPLAGIALDTSGVEPTREQAGPIVSLVAQDHPLRQVVAILLYQSRCRCRPCGDTLVILPPAAPEIVGREVPATGITGCPN